MIAALSSAVLLWAAFAPAGCWPLAWIALVPLFFALDCARSKRAAFGLAYLSGLAFFILVLLWIHYVTALGLILLSLYCALYVGVFGVLYFWASCFSAAWRFALIPAGWVALEALRGWAFTGFNWGAIGQSQPPLALASLTGVAGVSFLVLGGNVFLKEALACWQNQRPLRPAIFCALVLLGLIVLPSLFSIPNMAHNRAPIRVALIQPNITLVDAWDPRLKEATVDRQLELSRQALAAGPGLIIWPETAFPNFTWERPDLLEKVKDFARVNRVYLLFGAVTRSADQDKYFNSAVLISPAGDIVGTGSKRHLVLFGEYIPFRKQLPFLQELVPIDDFTPGERPAFFDVPGLGKFGVLICFEDTLPELAREYTRLGAGFLVNMTNDAWFRDSGQPAMHLDNARFRSVENARLLLRATNTGESCVLDASGRELACVADKQGRRVLQDGFVVTSFYPEVQMTWYTKCGDWFILVCVMMLAAGLIASLRRKKPHMSGSRKILLIDDERTLHAMLKPILGSHGFEVISAMTGEEGLALAASEKPGLILLDVILPTIKGREVCKRLKASSATAHIPVLFLTAKDSDDDVKAEMAAGAIGHVSKPINSASLVRLINKTISS
ncbi:MAG: apolipoprotein N-acyltransferase [Candidatus Omnitrophota bacterium]